MPTEARESGRPRIDGMVLALASGIFKAMGVQLGNLDWSDAENPWLTRFSIELKEPKEILIRFSLHQRVLESPVTMNCSTVVIFLPREWNNAFISQPKRPSETPLTDELALRYVKQFRFALLGPRGRPGQRQQPLRSS